MKPFTQDPIFVWLIGATFAFTAIMVGVAVKLPDHVPLFTVLQGLTTGFAGGFWRESSRSPRKKRKLPARVLLKRARQF